MRLHEISRPKGSRRKIKRLGRGSGSGHGKTSTKGHKGLKARSGAGGKLRIGFEGGQMPLIRRVPKHGFSSRSRSVVQIVNVEELNAFRKDDTVTPAKMKEENLIRSAQKSVKILGNGEIKKPLNVQAHFYSKGAKEKIVKAGGEAAVIKKEVTQAGKK